MEKSTLEQFRYFLKDSVRQAVDFRGTDQSLGIPPPPIEKPYDPESTRIDLTRPEEWAAAPTADLLTAIRERRSHRRYLGQPLTLDELAFLLWATQGISRQLNAATAVRTVPSAGSRHAFETYVCALSVTGLERGVYRYLPLEHQLLFEFADERLSEHVTDATLGQSFAGQAAATFVWTAIPYRMEWRYGLAAHKVIALDAGHVCQNLYLACAAIGAGTCAIAAYHQAALDALLRVDGQEEFAIYLAPVGKVGK